MQNAGVSVPRKAYTGEAAATQQNNPQVLADAIARSVTQTLVPVLVSTKTTGSNLQPLLVGTLIADDRGLRELNRRMELVNVQENARKGK